MGAAVNWWLEGGVDDVVGGIFDVAIESGEASGQNAFESIVGAIVVALVDVSHPTEHLLWEVGLLRGGVNARMLPVGRRDRVEALLAADRSAGSDTGDVAVRLRDLLGGEDILAYEVGADRGHARGFAQNLAVALNQTAR